MNKRYQVFVSSTYEDLKEERAAVLHALLRGRYIPAGMEYFTAGNLPPWERIQRHIDESDYYVLIIGGRYGSIVPEAEISYTQREYEYAESKGLPIICFLHGEPGKIEVEKTDRSPKKARKLAKFTQLVKKRDVDFYTSAEDLAHKVSSAVSIEVAEGAPRPGWVQGSQAANPRDLQRIIELQDRIQELENLLASKNPLSPEDRYESLGEIAKWILRKAIHPTCTGSEVAGDGSSATFNYRGLPAHIVKAHAAAAGALLRSAKKELIHCDFFEHVGGGFTPSYQASAAAFSLTIEKLGREAKVPFIDMGDYQPAQRAGIKAPRVG